MPDPSSSLNKKLKNFFSFFYRKNENKSLESSENTQPPKSEVLHNWSYYQKLKAEDIMIPRTDIVALSYSSNLEEIAEIFLESRHTRMPVYKDNLDNIIGFINIKDILPCFLNKNNSVKLDIDKSLRKLLIISPSMRIFDLLEKMRQTRTHIALVIDEFGGVDGLITVEDLVEEIIGKIEDEHDQSEELEFKKLDDNNFEASGRIEIEQLEEKLGLTLSEEGQQYDTLGGLILSIYGSVPEKSSEITHASTGLIFKILDSDPRRIKKVLIHKS